MLKYIATAAYELYFLLARNYPSQPAIKLIAARHGLTHSQQVFLLRCVQPPSRAVKIREKLVDAQDVGSRTLIVDYYNQATTIIAALNPDIDTMVVKCLDGLTRDNSLGKHVPKPKNPLTSIAAQLLVYTISMLKPRKTILVLDSRVSKSGQLASQLRKLRKNVGSIIVVTSRYADKTIILLAKRYKAVVASSDIVILEQVDQILDLAGYIVEQILGIKVNNITQTILQQHYTWCKGP
ncbi:MAG TPA: DUF434 domain-containing protein [Pyrodictium sp.]|nr:DUF434 domain-containing protein [Pyrodictium sp.]